VHLLRVIVIDRALLFVPVCTRRPAVAVHHVGHHHLVWVVDVSNANQALSVRLLTLNPDYFHLFRVAAM
tara:strand:- start:478 stop:684 length:207 start_codon:yes stop_codon:yes gene_type:complete